MIIQVLPQTPYNFSYLASGASESVIVADNIPVSGARTVALSVRIHRLTLSAGASFEFKITGVDPSPTDGTVFASGSLASTGNITSSSPNLVGLSAIISDPVYPFVRVTLNVTGPSSTGTTYFELSADLVVRQANAVLNEQSRAEAAFVQEMLHALHTKPPRSNGTLAEFTDSVKAGPGAQLTADSKLINCPTSDLPCVIRKMYSKASLCCDPPAPVPSPFP